MMPMYRLFVAIRPPRAARERLLALMQGIRGARWQDDTQLHLTLRFIGEVDRHCAEDIAAVLGQIRFPAFEIAVEGADSFEKKGRPSALWVGVAPRPPLQKLRNKIESALRTLGLEPDHRIFLPHITIARLNASSGPVGGFIADHAALTGPVFTVAHFDLFESTLSRAGAHYEIIARYPLKADG